jgi:hypothetical protein
MLPPELDELTGVDVLPGSVERKRREEEIHKETEAEKAGGSEEAQMLASYLMKRDSRNWSRPTKDFTVR